MSSQHAAGPPTSMPPRSQQLGFLAAIVGMFMAVLDIQIVASSLNEVQAGVAASRSEISWVQTSYLIAEIVMIPLAGTLSRVLSTRTALVISCGGFTLASIGCAMSTSLSMLIVMRVLQGFLGGALIPLTQAVSFGIFPRNRMGSVQAVMGLVATLAPSIGPTLGGYVTEHLSWHWLFLLNVPPGLLACWVMWRNLDIDKREQGALGNLDYWGLIFMALFLGALEFVLEQGNDDGWFGDRMIFWMAVVSGVSCVLFLWRAFTAENPIVDLRLFRFFNFSVGTLIIFVLGVALYGLVYLTPLFFGTIRDYPSVDIGEVMFVTGAAMFVAAPLLGRFGDRVSHRTLILVGLVMVATGTIMNANLTAQSGFHEFLWPQIIRGVGMIACIIPASRITIGILPANKIGEGAGMFSLMRNLGGAVGLAMIDTILDMRDHYHWQQLIPAVNDGRQAVLERITQYEQIFQGVTADPHTSAIQLLARNVNIQAQVLAYNDIFLWMGLLYILLIPLALIIRSPSRA
ncbi:DHA2 family efflux MFS transporter permease subunit [Carnimonas bestiolae]|uniref:DHA2 family efflux MFS transporter permease subunit n=1 Tax=Carnimonas bestiolae TaxID=3402172 RepID=UPI003F4AC663